MVLTLGSNQKVIKLNREPSQCNTNFLEGMASSLKNCFISGEAKRVDANYAVAEGKIECEIATYCSRCGADVNLKLTIPFKEEFSTDENNDDCYELNGSQIDLDQMIADLILTNFPTSILCRKDCRGRCDRCGKNLNEGKCDCDKEIELDDPANPFNELKKLKEDRRI